MKIFGLELFSKKIKTDDEQVTTVGLTNFWILNGLQYNSEVINSDTLRKISKHYQVAAALAVIGYSIQQIDWFIQTDNENVKKVCTLAVERIWNRLIRSVSKSFIYGYSPNVKVFTLEKIDGKNYIIYKKIKDLSPSDCQVKVDKWGNFDGFVYRKGTQYEATIDSDYCFWYVNNMEAGNLYGESMLKNIYKPWWFSEKIHEFSNRYYERFGEPLVVGRAPSGAKVKNSFGVVKGAQELMNDIIGSIRNHSSVQLPSDRHPDTKEYNYDLKYLESQMRGFDFENYLSRLDMEIARGLLLPELVFGGVKGGSYALGAAQIQAFYTNLMGIMDNIVDYVNLYILPQILDYNFERNKSAKFAYQPLSVDAKKNIQDLIITLVKSGKVKPNISQLEDRSGIKLEEEKILPNKNIKIVDNNIDKNKNKK